jgi:hypothetical protein
MRRSVSNRKIVAAFRAFCRPQNSHRADSSVRLPSFEFFEKRPVIRKTRPGLSRIRSLTWQRPAGAFLLESSPHVTSVTRSDIKA